MNVTKIDEKIQDQEKWFKATLSVRQREIYDLLVEEHDDLMALGEKELGKEGEKQLDDKLIIVDLLLGIGNKTNIEIFNLEYA